MAELGDKPFWAKCGDCSHCWPVAYLPMTMELFGKIGKRGSICPKCGSEKVFVAKQDDGVLQEPQARA